MTNFVLHTQEEVDQMIASKRQKTVPAFSVEATPAPLVPETVHDEDEEAKILAESNIVRITDDDKNRTGDGFAFVYLKNEAGDKKQVVYQKGKLKVRFDTGRKGVAKAAGHTYYSMEYDGFPFRVVNPPICTNDKGIKGFKGKVNQNLKMQLRFPRQGDPLDTPQFRSFLWTLEQMNEEVCQQIWENRNVVFSADRRKRLPKTYDQFRDGYFTGLGQAVVITINDKTDGTEKKLVMHGIEVKIPFRHGKHTATFFLNDNPPRPWPISDIMAKGYVLETSNILEPTIDVHEVVGFNATLCQSKAFPVVSEWCMSDQPEF